MNKKVYIIQHEATGQFRNSKGALVKHPIEAQMYKTYPEVALKPGDRILWFDLHFGDTAMERCEDIIHCGEPPMFYNCGACQRNKKRQEEWTRDPNDWEDI